MGLTTEESVRMAEDRDECRKYIHGMANPRIVYGLRTERNTTASFCSSIRLLPFEIAKLWQVSCNEMLTRKTIVMCSFPGPKHFRGQTHTFHEFLYYS